MVKKEFYFTGSGKQFCKFKENLKNEYLRFTTIFEATDCDGYHGNLRIRVTISPDMVQEVEDLIKEIAEKSGVKVE